MIRMVEMAYRCQLSLGAIGLACAMASVHAADPPAAAGNSGSAATGLPAFAPTADPCKADVAQFERSLSTMRAGLGDKAVAEFRERKLPAKTQEEILLKDGYCGLSKHLRDKRLIN